MLKTIKENIWFQIIAILIIAGAIWFILACILPDHGISSYLAYDIKHNKEESVISFIYYFFAIYLSALLASIAYFNLSRLNKEVKAKFLLEIDKRWGESQIIEAREVIHQFYLDARKVTQIKVCQIAIISEGILTISRSEKEKHIKQYLRLLNFLDFMETIGYLHENKDVDYDQLDKLCGSALKFNFQVFKPLIERKRKDHIDPTLYENFETLYLVLMSKNPKA